jgi:hypothetical protein
MIAWCRLEARRNRDFAEHGETVRQRRRNLYRAKTFDRIADTLGQLLVRT